VAPCGSDVFPTAGHFLAPPAAPDAPAPVAVPATPLGVCATEENNGNVRAERCGPNLCGYA
jgi:hypothetical protein